MWVGVVWGGMMAWPQPLSTTTTNSPPDSTHFYSSYHLPPTPFLFFQYRYLDKYDEIPFKVLRFLFTEINYGGRVTDDKDRRLINNLVHTFTGPDVLLGDYK